MGYYRAEKLDEADKDGDGDVDADDRKGWPLVPSNAVRRASDSEKNSAVESRLPTWIKLYDSSRVKYYYYNNFTRESVWEQPEDYVEPSKGLAARGMLMSPEVKAACVVQRAYRAKQARRVLQNRKDKERAKSRGRRAIKGWALEVDKATGRNYWYNMKTKETTWTMPEELREPKFSRKHLHKVVFRNFDADGNEIISDPPEHAAEDDPERRGEEKERESSSLETPEQPQPQPSPVTKVYRPPSSIGMELVSRKRGGSIVKSVTAGGQAALAGVKRGQVILRVGDMDVQTKSLSRILEALRSQPRPVTVLFKKAKTVKGMDKDALKVIGKHAPVNVEVTCDFHISDEAIIKAQKAGWPLDPSHPPKPPSLGLELVGKRSGGVFIKSLRPGGLAAATGKLRRSMTLKVMNGNDVSRKKFTEIVAMISNPEMWPLQTVWRVAPSRNLDREGKRRPEKKSGDSTTKADGQTATSKPQSRGRQRDRMDPNRPAKTKFEVVFFEGTSESLGIELAPRRGGGGGSYVGDKDPDLASEGVILARLVEGGAVRKGMPFCRGGKFLRKGCRLLEVNGEDVHRLPFKPVLERLLTRERPLTTVWKLAPSRSLTPEGKVRQEIDSDVVENRGRSRERTEGKQMTEIDVKFPQGTEPLGLVLAQRRPRSAKQRRMFFGGLTGCGAVVVHVKEGSIAWKATRKRSGGSVLRKGMQLVAIDGAAPGSAETLTIEHTTTKAARFVCQAPGSNICYKHTALLVVHLVFRVFVGILFGVLFSLLGLVIISSSSSVNSSSSSVNSISSSITISSSRTRLLLPLIVLVYPPLLHFYAYLLLPLLLLHFDHAVDPSREKLPGNLSTIFSRKFCPVPFLGRRECLHRGRRLPWISKNSSQHREAIPKSTLGRHDIGIQRQRCPQRHL